jgi:hypothetical protein
MSFYLNIKSNVGTISLLKIFLFDSVLLLMGIMMMMVLLFALSLFFTYLFDDMTF